MTAEARGWGPPCSQPVAVLVRSDGMRLPVHAELADLTALLCDLTEMLGYDLVPGWCWGGLCRKISGSSSWSNHAWWLADDLNAPANPYASADWHRRNARGTMPFGLRLVCDIPQRVVELWEAHGYRWGGRYGTKPDPMHFEFMGSPADARAHTARLRDFLAGHGQPAPPPPSFLEDDMPTVVAVDLAVDPEHPTRGYKLDAKGGIHPFGGAPKLAGMDDAYAEWEKAGVGPARRLVISSWGPQPQGYVLDALGGVHGVGGAPDLPTAGYWPKGFLPPAPVV